MNCKKAISEEVDIVKQLDAELRAFKELPGSRRSSSPPIPAKSFVFQPLDEYPTSSGAPLDDPDVWRPPSRDSGSRRSTRAGPPGMRKSSQDATWARGASRAGTGTGTGTPSRTVKSGTTRGGRTPSSSGVGAKKGKPTGKADSQVNYLEISSNEELFGVCAISLFVCVLRVVMQKKGSRRRGSTKDLMRTWRRCWRGMSWRQALGSGGMMLLV